MTITSEVERLDTGDSEGCKYRGYHREVISGKENTTYPYILKPAESGALCVHGAADGLHGVALGKEVFDHGVPGKCIEGVPGGAAGSSMSPVHSHNDWVTA